MLTRDDALDSTDSVDPATPEPEVKPSSTPGGPQVIPSPTTPEGEPGPDPAPERGRAGYPGEHALDSNPSGSSPEGLAGGMGVSSERTGPRGLDPRTTVTADDGIEGTGSVGGSLTATDGTMRTEPARAAGQGQQEVPRVHPEEPSEGAEAPGEHGTEPRVHPEDPAEGADDPRVTEEESTARAQRDYDGFSGVDRTVGEVNPAQVPSHRNHPDKNPGHSHGG